QARYRLGPTGTTIDLGEPTGGIPGDAIDTGRGFHYSPSTGRFYKGFAPKAAGGEAGIGKITARDAIAMRAAGIDPATGQKLTPAARLTAKREERALARSRFAQAEATAAGGVAGRPLPVSAQQRVSEIEEVRTLVASLRE